MSFRWQQCYVVNGGVRDILQENIKWFHHALHESLVLLEIEIEAAVVLEVDFRREAFLRADIGIWATRVRVTIATTTSDEAFTKITLILALIG